MEREETNLQKKRTVRRKNHWTELKKKKRKDHNPNYNKKRVDVSKTRIVKYKKKWGRGFRNMEREEEYFDDTVKDFPGHEYTDPDEVPLDQAVKFMKKGIGGELEVIFHEDASDDEIDEILRLIEENL